MRQFYKSLKQMISPSAVYWSGDYSSWTKVSSDCDGYSEKNISERMLNAAEAVINGRAAFCRDGMIFQKSELNWPLVAIARGLRTKLGRPLRVIDFGGAFGDTFLQNRSFLAEIVASWSVVEQDVMLEHAAKLPVIEKLRFFVLMKRLSKVLI
jgi:putative methyltransferase (TIGR04325 family)